MVFAKAAWNGKKDNVLELLRIFGLEESDFEVVDKLNKYENVVVPDSCFWFDDINIDIGKRYFTPEYKELIERVHIFQKEHFNVDDTCKKIYFAHGNYGNGNGSIGEEKLENFFLTKGYKIVHPEMYTLMEQLNMLANCSNFASTVGSCSHNIIFLQEHTEVILIPRAYYMTGYQLALDQVTDLDIYYVDSTLSVLVKNTSPHGGPFYYYVSENLQKFFGTEQKCDIKYYGHQLRDLKKYLRRLYVSDDLSKRYVPEYYEKQFMNCAEKLQAAHPKRTFLWIVVLKGPNKIKRTLGEMITKIIKRK